MLSSCILPPVEPDADGRAGRAEPPTHRRAAGRAGAARGRRDRDDARAAPAAGHQAPADARARRPGRDASPWASGGSTHCAASRCASYVGLSRSASTPAHPSEDVLVDYPRGARGRGARTARTDTIAIRVPEVERIAGRAARRGLARVDVGRLGPAGGGRRSTSRSRTAEVEPVAGRPSERSFMAEGDGTRHRAEGRFLELTPPADAELRARSAGPSGAPARSPRRARAAPPSRDRPPRRLTMTIRVSGERPAAAPALAGMQIGWGQSLDKLADELAER